MVYAPSELGQKFAKASDGKLWLQSSVYLRSGMERWLPGFLAQMAILQPIDAKRQGEFIAAMLHGKVDESAPTPGGATDYRDELLTVGESVYVPAGKEPSRWKNTNEFEQFVERFGQNDVCFGTADPSGLTLETPFGDDSALIRLLTNVGHPWLGNGLLAALILPPARDQQTLENECAWYNYFEAINWTGFPQLGSWSPSQRGKQQFTGNGFFLPNALHCGNLVTNVSLWQMARARWVKMSFFPELQDQSMTEILELRWKAIGRDVPA